MKEFQELLEVVDRLLGPDGCPWDRKQTLASVREDLLEESCELIEAIDLKDSRHIQEELGDLFFLVLFLCRLAEKEESATMAGALQEASEKLIRRHPHIFGEEQASTASEVKERWDEIKKKEPDKAKRTHILDGISYRLPALARAQEIIKRVRKSGFRLPQLSETNDPEKLLGLKILNLVEEACDKDIAPEQALRAVLAEKEEALRKIP